MILSQSALVFCQLSCELYPIETDHALFHQRLLTYHTVPRCLSVVTQSVCPSPQPDCAGRPAPAAGARRQTQGGDEAALHEPRHAETHHRDSAGDPGKGEMELDRRCGVYLFLGIWEPD